MTLGPRAFLVLSASSFGGAWVAAPWAVAEIPPFAVACLRFAVAAVLLYGWCRVRGVEVRASRADIPIVAGVAATSVVAYNLLFLDGVRLTPASHGASHPAPDMDGDARVVLIRPDRGDGGEA